MTSRMSEEAYIGEGQRLVLFKYGLNVGKSACTIGVPSQTQLGVLLSWFARLKDMEPSMWICGRCQGYAC